jgi:hypothetical protein
MGLIITGDDLFSRQPTIETVPENKFHFFFVAKPASHGYMMEWLDTYESLHESALTHVLNIREIPDSYSASEKLFSHKE